MLRTFAAVSLIFAFLVAQADKAHAGNLPKWFPFNKENAIEEWEEKVFENRVLYSIKSAGEKGYLLAQSKEACSGLIYRIEFSPRQLPMISWNWQVRQFPDKQKADAHKGGWIEKDDYAARVYVMFPSWYFMHIRCLEYIWDESLPEGTIITSPYFRNIKLMVVESGKREPGTWVHEERNIYEDYKRAFGRYPAGNVAAIALMTDTDNTFSTAEALYSDIKVGYRK